MAEVIFIYEGKSIIIQCDKCQKMMDICENLSNKLNIDINSLVFLYGGGQLNLEKKLNEISKDNKIKILVYNNDIEICPKCRRILNNDKIDEIMLLNNNINDTLTGIKSQIENIINDK